MRVVTGSDWSIGLGLDSSLDFALLNARLGDGLREVYSDTVEQPLPSEFGQLLERISGGRADVSGAALSCGPRGATK
ncbi:NepR family anti-sigma factor [Methylobacterium sp. P31]